MPVAAVGGPAHHTQRCTGVSQHGREPPTGICSSENGRKVLLPFLLEPPEQVFLVALLPFNKLSGATN